MAPRLSVSSILGDAAADWDRLVDAAPVPSPFLRSWWLDAVVGDARILLVHDSDELIGGLPLEADRVFGVERLRVAGADLAPDHVDLIARSESEPVVVRTVAEWLRRPGSRILDMDGLSGNSRLEAALPRRQIVRRIGQAMYTPLPSSFDEFLSERSKATRRSIRRARRRLEADGARVEWVDRAHLSEALNDLRRLHAELFGGSSTWLPHFDAFAAAAPRGFEAGELAINQLVVGGHVVASETFFECAERLSLYQGGRLPTREFRGAGVVLQSHAIERACDRGFAEFDFLRGDSDLKQRWTTDARPLVRLRSAVGVGGHVALAGSRIRGKARDLIGRWKSREHSAELDD